jgi:uncharacterized membrane-anchored protein
MSSTFLTRLKVGEILVDARGVSRLFRGRVGLWPFVALAIAGLGVIAAVLVASEDLQNFVSLLASRISAALGLE